MATPIKRVATVAAFNQKGELLLGKRLDSGKWTMPGGHLEEGERPLKGAIRELLEEANLKPEEMEFLDYGKSDDEKVVVYAFQAKVTKGTPSGKNDPDQECEEWRWVDVSNGLPREYAENLHNQKNVLLRVLGLQKGKLIKAEGRFSAAAFRHRDSGKVYATGPFHDLTKLPGGFEVNLEDYDQGFVDHQGQFYTRLEAQQLLERPHVLHSHHLFEENPSRKYFQSTRPGEFAPGLKKDEPPRAENPSLTPAQLKLLLTDPAADFMTFRSVVNHPNADAEVWKLVAMTKKPGALGVDLDESLKEPMSRGSRNITPEVAGALLDPDNYQDPTNATSAYYNLKEHHSQHILPQHLEKLAERGVGIGAILAEKNLSPTTMGHIIRHLDPLLAERVTSHPSMTPGLALEMFQNPHPSARGQDVLKMRQGLVNRKDLLTPELIQAVVGLDESQTSPEFQTKHDLLGRLITTAPERLTTDHVRKLIDDQYEVGGIPVAIQLLTNPQVQVPGEVLNHILTGTGQWGQPSSHQDVQLAALQRDGVTPGMLQHLADKSMNMYVLEQAAKHPLFTHDMLRTAVMRNATLTPEQAQTTQLLLRTPKVSRDLLNEYLVKRASEGFPDHKTFLDHPLIDEQMVEDLADHGYSVLNHPKVSQQRIDQAAMGGDPFKQFQAIQTGRVPRHLLQHLIQNAGDETVKQKARRALAEVSPDANFSESVHLKLGTQKLRQVRDYIERVNPSAPTGPRSKLFPKLAWRAHPSEEMDVHLAPEGEGEDAHEYQITLDRTAKGSQHELHIAGPHAPQNNLLGTFKTLEQAKGAASVRHKASQNLPPGHLHPLHLPSGDWSVGKTAQGLVSSKKLQEHLDSLPATRFNLSRTTYDQAQLHSEEPSQVLQVNITDDHLEKLKQAGVHDTFRSMVDASYNSSHPVVKNFGIGWVRYTGSPESGFFIDEIQSDLGQSFVRQAAAQARQNGMDEQEAVREAEKKWPEEHYKKISQLLFQGKHPNEILMEAFHQSMRDQGHHEAPVHIHTVESKAPLSDIDLTSNCQTCGVPQDEHEDKVPDHSYDPMEWDCASCGGNQDSHQDHPYESVEDGGDCPCGMGEEWHHAPVKPQSVECNRCNHPEQAHEQAHKFKPGKPDRLKAPGHFNVTYHDLPKKYGMEPSTYGTLPTQTGKESRGKPTWAGKIRKAEPDEITQALSGISTAGWNVALNSPRLSREHLKQALLNPNTPHDLANRLAQHPLADLAVDAFWGWPTRAGWSAVLSSPHLKPHHLDAALNAVSESYGRFNELLSLGSRAKDMHPEAFNRYLGMLDPEREWRLYQNALKSPALTPEAARKVFGEHLKAFNLGPSSRDFEHLHQHARALVQNPHLPPEVLGEYLGSLKDRVSKKHLTHEAWHDLVQNAHTLPSNTLALMEPGQFLSHRDNLERFLKRPDLEPRHLIRAMKVGDFALEPVLGHGKADTSVAHAFLDSYKPGQASPWWGSMFDRIADQGVLTRMVSHPDETIRVLAASHSKLTDEQVRNLFDQHNESESRVHQALVNNRRLKERPGFIEMMAGSKDMAVQEDVAGALLQAEHIPDSTLSRLLQARQESEPQRPGRPRSSYLIGKLLESPQKLGPQMLDQIAQGKFGSNATKTLFAHTSLATPERLALAFDSTHPEARHLALRHPNLPAHLKEQVLKGKGQEDLRHLADNPSLDKGQIDFLLAKARSEFPAEARRGLYARLVENSTPHLGPDHLHKVFDDAAAMGEDGWGVAGVVLDHDHLDEGLVRKGFDYLLKHHALQDQEFKAFLPSRLQKLLEHHHVPVDVVDRALHPDFPVKTVGILAEAKEAKRRLDPDSFYQAKKPGQVHIKLGTQRLRAIRDHIETSTQTGEMHPKQLPQGIDWAPFRTPAGLVSAKKIQEYIDHAPAARFNLGEDKWNGVQRHDENKPSKVLRFNVTNDHLRQLKEAGVYKTFLGLLSHFHEAGHPIDPHHTVGWVRWTGDPRHEIHIDEAQSDLTQDLATNLYNKMRREPKTELRKDPKTLTWILDENGHPKEFPLEPFQPKHSEEECQKKRQKMERKFPPEHQKKIREILFHGKKPSDVLVEGFLQHQRDNRRHKVPVHMMAVETKAAISLDDPTKGIPAHFKEEYEATPKRMGMVPGQYGELKHQVAEDLKGKATWKTTVKKNEPLEKMAKKPTLVWRDFPKRTGSFHPYDPPPVIHEAKVEHGTYRVKDYHAYEKGYDQEWDHYNPRANYDFLYQVTYHPHLEKPRRTHEGGRTWEKPARVIGYGKSAKQAQAMARAHCEKEDNRRFQAACRKLGLDRTVDWRPDEMLPEDFEAAPAGIDPGIKKSELTVDERQPVYDQLARWEKDHGSLTKTGMETALRYSLPRHLPDQAKGDFERLAATLVPAQWKTRTPPVAAPANSLLAHPSPEERLMALKLPGLTELDLAYALHDQDPRVALAALDHPTLVPLTHALKHPEPLMRLKALYHPKLQPQDLIHVFADQHPVIQHEVMTHPKLPTAIARRVLDMGVPTSSKVAAVANPKVHPNLRGEIIERYLKAPQEAHPDLVTACLRAPCPVKALTALAHGPNRQLRRLAMEQMKNGSHAPE